MKALFVDWVSQLNDYVTRVRLPSLNMHVPGAVVLKDRAECLGGGHMVPVEPCEKNAAGNVPRRQ